MRGKRRMAGLGLLLGLGVAAPGPAAWAMTVSAPTAATLPMAAPVVVQWSSTPGPGVIDIRLVRVTPTSFNFADLAIAIANTGQATVRLPDTASCNPAHTYRISVMRRQTSGNGTAWLDWGDTPAFRLTCAADTKPDPRPGEVTVTKQIVNTTAFPTPVSDFQVVVTCRPSNFHSTVTLSAPRDLQQTVSIPSGDLCSILELPPTPPKRPCAWVTRYPLGQQARPGGRLTVVNELTCGDSGGGQGGRVKVTKAAERAPGPAPTDRDRR